MNTTVDLEARIADYVEALNQSAPQHTVYKLLPVVVTHTYRRIVRVQYERHLDVHAFVDAQGRIYKPAGWQGPVKNGAAYDLRIDESYQALLTDAVRPGSDVGGHLYYGKQSYILRKGGLQ